MSGAHPTFVININTLAVIGGAVGWEEIEL